MSDAGSRRFAAGVEPWRELLGLARDAVRQELVTRQLRAHSPDPRGGAVPIRVLDAGCGQGTQVIRLARSGFHVVGVDLAEDLLDVARAALRDEPAEVRARVELRHADLLDAEPGAERFDVVCCHGVVMYLDSLDAALAALEARLRPGGLLSLLCRNRAGIAMRAGMTGDWAGALDGFDARRYRNRLGISDVRADDPDEVIAALGERGIDTVAWYGVRLFTDHWGDVDPPADLDILVAAEQEAGRRDPYRRLAALFHVIGTLR
ncbi:MAG: class I SAM-dependent methyltransferase [Egibacteraceae bacterium]